MYNRYIPQPDGSYRRNRILDPGRPHQQSVETTHPPQLEQQPPEPAASPCSGCIHRRSDGKPQQNHQVKPTVSISRFLKQLLPKNFDTEDLIVVLLLLLMAGDCQEDQNAALLTLILYLFL